MAEALYRKYRSNTFADVVGQEHVVRTLTSALASGRLRHAYLFTGPRGVGKTSVARLLARALNCTGEPKPCNQCPNCLTAINSSLDIIEMDAASNRSIDSIRDLRDKVNLAPTQGQYKVYIIDEVHMLTTEAFNALLKTLEEPPSHVVFILATTEAHKLPETIVSRTQAFSFKRISEEDIVKQLQKITASEKIMVSEAALKIVAASAGGSFRDAISTLDQLASSKAEITDEQVRELLGYTTTEEIDALSLAIAKGSPAEALRITARLHQAGAQATRVANQLALQWRTALLANTGILPKAPNSATQELAELPIERIASVIEKLVAIEKSDWPQLSLEATLVQLAHPISVVDTVTVTDTAQVKIEVPVTNANKTQPDTSTGAPKTLTPEKSTQSSPEPKGISSHSQSASADAKLWPKVLMLIKAENNSLAALLQMYPLDFSDAEITIKPRFNFHRDLFLKTANRTAVETAIAKVYGRRLKFSARTEETGKPGRRGRGQTADLVSSALEILGGEVIE